MNIEKMNNLKSAAGVSAELTLIETLYFSLGQFLCAKGSEQKHAFSSLDTTLSNLDANSAVAMARTILRLLSTSLVSFGKGWLRNVGQEELLVALVVLERMEINRVPFLTHLGQS